MIVLLITSIVVIAAIMYFGKKLMPKTRIVVSVAAFILINLPTIMFLIVGDKPLPGARTVTPQEIHDAARNK